MAVRNLRPESSVGLGGKRVSFCPFSISVQFSSIWPIDRTLSDATTPRQSGPGSDVNEGALRIPQSSSITEARRFDCLVIIRTLVGVFSLGRDAVGVFYCFSRLSKAELEIREPCSKIVQRTSYLNYWYDFFKSCRIK